MGVELYFRLEKHIGYATQARIQNFEKGGAHTVKKAYGREKGLRNFEDLFFWLFRICEAYFLHLFTHFFYKALVKIVVIINFAKR